MNSPLQGIIICCLGLVMLVAGIMFAIPQYNVYNKRLHGEAILAEANASRQVLIKQAEAERDAAKARAEAIGIVGRAAKEYPEYRQQEFIGAFAEALKEGKISQIMYIPTEANIPITEAGHLTPPTK